MFINRLKVYNNTMIKIQHTWHTLHRCIYCHIKMYQYINLKKTVIIPTHCSEYMLRMSLHQTHK